MHLHPLMCAEGTLGGPLKSGVVANYHGCRQNPPDTVRVCEGLHQFNCLQEGPSTCRIIALFFAKNIAKIGNTHTAHSVGLAIQGWGFLPLPQ